MDRDERYIDAALKRACTAVENAQVSNRNDTLNSEAYGIGQLVGADMVSFRDAENALLAAALRLGLDRHEAASTIRSALRGGMKKPRDRNGAGASAAPNGATPQKRSTGDLAAQIYREAKPLTGTLAERYLREARRLAGAIPSGFRFHPQVWHREAKRTFPALIAPIVDLGASRQGIVAVHVTFLNPETAAKAPADPAKKMLGKAKGGAVWLGDYASHMLLTEGIEKGLAVQAATSIPTAAGLSATLMQSMDWPAGTARVTICADPNLAGERGLRRAAEQWRQRGIEVLICYPPRTGADWDECTSDEVRDAVGAAVPYSVPSRDHSGPSTVSADIPDEWQRDEHGRLIKNEGNVLLALKLAGIVVRWNTFSFDYIISGLDGYGPALNDHALDELYLQIQREHGLKPSKEDFDRVVLAAARRNRFDPLLDYLDSLEWDGVDRIDEWLTTYMGAAPDEAGVVRHIGKTMLIAAVRRARQPGCKFDEMVVLEGAQGIGKSRAIAALCPNPEWFTDNVSLGADQRSVMELTAGKWICEIAELSGMRRSDTESTKAFFSRQVDEARLAYARLKEKRPRRFIFVGSTNEEQYLVDPTGNRRYLTVRVGAVDVDGIARDRDLLWAEACHYEAKGVPIYTPDEIKAPLSVMQSEREETDEWSGIIRAWLDTNYPASGDMFRDQHVTLGDVGTRALNIPWGTFTSADQKRIARCMRGIGWERCRKSNGVWKWRRSVNAQSD